MQNKKAVAVYIRLSDEDENIDGKLKQESNSVSAQRKLILDFISEKEEFKGYKICEYVDDGYSGTNTMRPQFQKMMKDAKCGLFDTICVKDFSRFGRDYIETGKLIEIILPTLQIRFISVNDKFDSDDCKGMTGGISVGLKNLLNAMYSQDLSKKVKSAMNTRAGNGQYMASLAPYGYKKNPDNIHKLTIDEEAAANVRMIFTMASEGVGKTAIARYFNENNILSPTAYVQNQGIKRSSYHEKQKKLWTVTTIGDMLRNQVYLGATVWNKQRLENIGSRKLIKNEPTDWCVTEGTHEPIVSKQLFELANEKAFRKRKVKRKHGKSGPLVFCAYCGRRMGAGDKYHKDYRCATQYMSGIPECRGNGTNQKELEEAVMTATRNMVSLLSINIEKKKAQWSQSARLKEEVEVLEQEKIRIKSRKMKLYERYRNASITKEKYMSELEKIQYRIKDIEQIIPKIREDIMECEKKLAEADEKQTELSDIAALQEFDKFTLAKVIERIIVYGRNQIEIIWKMDNYFYDVTEMENRSSINPSELLEQADKENA